MRLAVLILGAVLFIIQALRLSGAGRAEQSRQVT